MKITKVQLKKGIVFVLPGYDGTQVGFFSVPWELLSLESCNAHVLHSVDS